MATTNTDNTTQEHENEHDEHENAFDYGYENFNDYEHEGDYIIEDENEEVLETEYVVQKTMENFQNEFGDIHAILQQSAVIEQGENHEMEQDNTNNPPMQTTEQQEKSEQELDDNKENNANIDLDFLNTKMSKKETLADKDLCANNTKQQFEEEFQDIHEIIQLSNAVENNIIDDRDTKDLDKKPINLDKERGDLEKAIDNLSKTRDLGQLLKALYMLDDALFAINEKRDDKDNCFEKLKKAAEKGKNNTVEYTIMALKAIKQGYDKISTYLDIRKKEASMQKEISTQTHNYKLALTDKQKAMCYKNIKNNMEFAKKDLPNFTTNYPETCKRANKVIKSHEKALKKEKDKDMGKGREL